MWPGDDHERFCGNVIVLQVLHHIVGYWRGKLDAAALWTCPDIKQSVRHDARRINGEAKHQHLFTHRWHKPCWRGSARPTFVCAPVIVYKSSPGHRPGLLRWLGQQRRASHRDPRCRLGRRPDIRHDGGYMKRWMKVSAGLATSGQPWSRIRECPRPSISTYSVTSGFLSCFL